MTSLGVPMVLAMIMPMAMDQISALMPYRRMVFWLPRILASTQRA